MIRFDLDAKMATSVCANRAAAPRDNVFAGASPPRRIRLSHMVAGAGLWSVDQTHRPDPPNTSWREARGRSRTATESVPANRPRRLAIETPARMIGVGAPALSRHVLTCHVSSGHVSQASAVDRLAIPKSRAAPPPALWTGPRCRLVMAPLSASRAMGGFS